MTKAIEQFNINVANLHNLTIIHEAFVDKINPLDISDILRSQIVLVVSALDCYFHDLCEEVMLSIFQYEDLTKYSTFKTFSISIDTLHQITNTNSDSEKRFFLSKEIKKRNSYKSFQEPNKISEALSFIGVSKIWIKIGGILKKNSKDLQSQLSLIISRRNQIAHESDINPTLGIGEKYAIDSIIVKQTISFIVDIVNTIDKIVTDEIF